MEHFERYVINQMFIKILLIIFTINFVANCDIKEAFAYLRQNHQTINNALSQCQGSTLIKYPWCGFPEMDGFKTILAGNSIVSDSIMARIVSDYMSYIHRLSYLLNDKKTDVICDDISVSFLSKLISNCSDRDGLGNSFAGLATQTLRKYVCYASLKRNENQIYGALASSCVDMGIRDEIRIIIGLKESEKQEMLKNKRVGIPYLARLGDPSAIKQLRDQYHNAQDFRSKERAIFNNFESGQIELIKMVISDFNNPTYDVSLYKSMPPCTSRSTQYITLQRVRRSYPDEKLLNEDFLDLLYVRDSNFSLEYNKHYIESVSKRLEKIYGVTINDKSKAFIIQKFFGCPNF